MDEVKDEGIRTTGDGEFWEWMLKIELEALNAIDPNLAKEREAEVNLGNHFKYDDDESD